MGKINWPRVLLGGILAGVVINAIEFVVNSFFLAGEWEATMKAMARTSPGGGGVVVFLVWGFLMGIGAVWLYAAARPRFGPGPRTAVLTGFAFWCLSSALCILDEAGVGLYRLRLLIILGLVCLPQAIAASLAGAWLYKEEESIQSPSLRAAGG